MKRGTAAAMLRFDFVVPGARSSASKPTVPSTSLHRFRLSWWCGGYRYPGNGQRLAFKQDFRFSGKLCVKTTKSGLPN